MSRNLKTLGLALVAAFAMSAIVSSAASATVATFTSGSEWTTLSASALTTQVFSANEGKEKFECTSLSFDGASMGTDQSEITVEPTYGTTLADEVTEAVATTSGCKVTIPAGTFPATVHTEKCHYLFTAEGTDGTMHINSTTTPACEIKATIYFLGKFRPCFDIPPQTPTKPTVTFTNETYVVGGKNVWDVRLKSNLEGITYTKTGVCGEGIFNDTTITGELTIKGKDTENNPLNVTFDPVSTEATFTSGSDWTTLSASALTTQVFSANEGKEKFECTSLSFDGASMGTDQSEITVEPTYGTTLAEEVTEAVATTSGCTIKIPAGTFPATVHTEKCHYLFTAEGTDGTMHINSTTTPACEIKITVYFLNKFRPCFEIPPQTPTKPTVTFTNETYVSGGKNIWDVKLTSSLEGITYTKPKGSVCGESHFNDAKYEGAVTIKGTDTLGAATNVTFDPAS